MGVLVATDNVKDGVVETTDDSLISGLARVDTKSTFVGTALDRLDDPVLNIVSLGVVDGDTSGTTSPKTRKNSGDGTSFISNTYECV